MDILNAACGNGAAMKAATELLAKYPTLQVEIYDVSLKSRTLVK